MKRDASRIRQRVLAWYREKGRDLPWRRSRDPYAIWVSEVMLQQTTVAAVVPYWERFLELFPDIESLARAPEDELLAAWAGLGYYRRARNLQAAARAIVEGGGTQLPDSHEDLLALPGVGAYTAAAVGSIAFGIPKPVVDGNVVRVLTRLDAMEGDPTRQPLKRRIEERARELLDQDEPGDFNQALMELGATVCTPRQPRCHVCPWQDACLGRQGADPARFPELPPRRRSVPVLRAALRIVDEPGRWLLARIPAGEANAGFWEPPSVTLFHGERDEGRAPARWNEGLAELAEQEAMRRFGVDALCGKAVARCSHGVTHHRIAVHFVETTLRAPPPSRADLAWTNEDERASLPLSAIAKKLLT